MQGRSLSAQPSRRDGMSAADLGGAPGASVDLTDYVGVVRRRLWLILAVTLLVGGLAWLSTARDIPLYRASATVLINPVSPTAVSTSDRTSARADQLINPATER